MKNNILYHGKVIHHRFYPVEHRFQYPVYMLFVELNTLPEFIDSFRRLSYERLNWLHYRRKDYFGDLNSDLQSCVEKALTLTPNSEPIYLLTNFACWGYCFNPLSIYMTLSEKEIKDCLLEVHNTPWGEKKIYPLTNPQRSNNTISMQFSKAMHVSPFLSMDYEYHFSMTKTLGKLSVNLENWRADKRHFLASLQLNAQAFTAENLHACLIQHPIITYRNILAIYWQALKIKLKGIPFYSHPGHKQDLGKE